MLNNEDASRSDETDSSVMNHHNYAPDPLIFDKSKEEMSKKFLELELSTIIEPGVSLHEKYCKQITAVGMDAAIITKLSLKGRGLNMETLGHVRVISSICPNIQAIDLSYNSLSGELSLDWMTYSLRKNLTDLDISHNSLSDMSCVVLLDNLVSLNASYNQIKTIVAGKCLVSMDVSNNLISDISSCRALELCTNLQHLSIHGNPIYPSNECISMANKRSPFSELKRQLTSLSPSIKYISSVQNSPNDEKHVEIYANKQKKTQVKLLNQLYSDRVRTERLKLKEDWIEEQQLHCEKELRRWSERIKPISQKDAQDLNRRLSASTESYKYRQESRSVPKTRKPNSKKPFILTVKGSIPPYSSPRKLSNEKNISGIEVNESTSEKSILLRWIRDSNALLADGCKSFALVCDVASYNELSASEDTLVEIENAKGRAIESLRNFLSLQKKNSSLPVSVKTEMELNGKRSVECARLIEDIAAATIVLQSSEAVVSSDSQSKSDIQSKFKGVRLRSYVDMLMQTEAGITFNERVLLPAKVFYSQLLTSRCPYERINTKIRESYDGAIDLPLSQIALMNETNRNAEPLAEREVPSLDIAKPLEQIELGDSFAVAAHSSKEDDQPKDRKVNESKTSSSTEEQLPNSTKLPVTNAETATTKAVFSPLRTSKFVQWPPAKESVEFASPAITKFEPSALTNLESSSKTEITDSVSTAGDNSCLPVSKVSSIKAAFESKKSPDSSRERVNSRNAQ